MLAKDLLKQSNPTPRVYVYATSDAAASTMLCDAVMAECAVGKRAGGLVSARGACGPVVLKSDDVVIDDVCVRLRKG